MKIKDLGLQAAYDVFVITRSDHIYDCQHSISEFFDPSALWVPTGSDYGGYTDRHLVVGKDLVLKALDILPPLLSRPRQEWPNGNLNPEKILKCIWEDIHGLSIKSFERVMFTVAGPTDTTRWMKPGDQALAPNYESCSHRRHQGHHRSRHQRRRLFTRYSQ